MKGLFFIPLLWILGYLVADGAFGTKVINGFEWLNIMYLIMLWIIGIVSVFFTFILITAGASNIGDKVNIFITAGGTLIMFMATLFAYFYYWLTNEIIANTINLATVWAELGSTDLIIIYIAIFVLGILTSKKLR